MPFFGTSWLLGLGALGGALLAAAVAAWRMRKIRETGGRLVRLVEARTAELAERTQQLQIANDLLQHLATIDDLTSIANARRFRVVLAQEWQRARRARGRRDGTRGRRGAEDSAP